MIRRNEDNLLSRSRIPTLAGDKVVCALPRHAVLAGGAVGVGSCASAVGPERVVETVVCACCAGRPGALNESTVVEREREGKGADDCRDSDEEGGERHHDDDRAVKSSFE